MKIQKAWFTLIELTIAMTIIAILMVSTYIPYSFVQTKNNISLATKDVSQIISTSHNLARNWLNNELDNREENIKTAVYIPEWASDKVLVYWFKHDVENAHLSLTDDLIIRELVIGKWISIWEINSWWIPLDNLVIVFDSITWESRLYEKSPSHSLIATWAETANFKLWKGSDWSNLQLAKKLRFYTHTNVVDITKD